MPLNPIDVQVMVPRAAEASKVQHVRDVVPQNDQQTLAGQEKARHEISQKQIQKSEQTVKPANEDEKEKKKKNKKGTASNAEHDDNPKQAGEQSHKAEDPNRGHLIDFSI